MEYGRPADGILMFICMMFLIFNVISGWFFLHDTGSCGLGAIILGYDLSGVAAENFPYDFCWPCLPISVLILSAVLSGELGWGSDRSRQIMAI